jgi:Ca2+-binding RTX toxin-like protein
MMKLRTALALPATALLVSAGLNLLTGAHAQADNLCGSGPGTQITGGPAGETLIGTPGDDRILGSGGDDTIFGLGGNDILVGGEGDDTVVGGDCADYVMGGPGDDQLDGGDGDDNLGGNGGDDTGDGGAGANICDVETAGAQVSPLHGVFIFPPTPGPAYQYFWASYCGDDPPSDPEHRMPGAH